MEFLKFIFSSPWIWLGFLILVCCVLKYAVDLVNALRAKRKVHTFKTSDGSWQVLVENATHNETLRPRWSVRNCANICVSS